MARPFELTAPELPRGVSGVAQPSYATPRSTERYSDGPTFARLIAENAGRTLTRWQRELLDVAAERVDGPGTPFAYDQIVVVVGRRAGKTVTALGCCLARAIQGAVKLRNGRLVPFHAAHTAQNLTQARKRFMEDIAEPYRDSIPAALWSPAHKIFRNLANTTLSIDPFGRDVQHALTSHIQVYAPTKSSVRGDGLLHLTLDEAMAFSTETGQAFMSAARPAMAEFGGHAQMWITSNVAADLNDTRRLVALRDRGREAVSSGRRDGIAYLEFSMPPEGDPADENLWWAHLPALGDGLVEVPQLRRDLEELGPAAFGAEYLGLWPGGASVKAWSAIPRTVWVDAATDAETPDGVPYTLGVDIDPFGRAATVVAASQAPGGPAVVEVIAHGDGSAWVRETLATYGPGALAIIVDDYGPGRDLVMTLAEKAPGLTIVPVTTRDSAAACYAFESTIGAGGVLHRHNDDMDAAVSAAMRTPGRSWVYERRLDTIQTPLWGAVLALWGLHHRRPDEIAPAIY